MTRKTRDISDRVYQGQVYRLFDEARSSITISMYVLKPGEHPKHPVNRLLEDLLEARGRGVKVTIYLNTKFEGSIRADQVTVGPWFDRLREAGVVLRLVSPVRRLHDKLLIVDRRFVVEGSTNWSVSAITDNFESATVIDSPELAEVKLKRIGFFPIWGEEAKKLPRPRKVRRRPEPLFPAGPPTSIEVPVALVEGRKYFPNLINQQSERALKLFLLLLFLREAKGQGRFLFSLESAAEFLGVLPGKDRSAVRRQMIRLLRDPESIGPWLEIQFHHGKEARLELLLPPGPAFTVGSTDLLAGELAGLTDNQIFLRLVRARLREEGKRFEDFSQRELMQRFFAGEEVWYGLTGGPGRRGGKPAPAPI